MDRVLCGFHFVSVHIMRATLTLEGAYSFSYYYCHRTKANIPASLSCRTKRTKWHEQKNKYIEGSIKHFTIPSVELNCEPNVSAPTIFSDELRPYFIQPTKRGWKWKLQQGLNSLTGRRDLSGVAGVAVKDWRMITCDGGKLAESAHHITVLQCNNSCVYHFCTAIFELIIQLRDLKKCLKSFWRKIKMIFSHDIDGWASFIRS